MPALMPPPDDAPVQDSVCLFPLFVIILTLTMFGIAAAIIIALGG